MVLAGENMAWQYPARICADSRFMLRSMLKPDRVWICTMARKVGDADAVAVRGARSWPGPVGR